MADSLSINTILSNVGASQQSFAQPVMQPSENLSSDLADGVTSDQPVSTDFAENQNTEVDKTQKDFKSTLDEVLAQSPPEDTDDGKDLPSETNAANLESSSAFLLALGQIAISAGCVDNSGVSDTQQEVTNVEVYCQADVMPLKLASESNEVTEQDTTQDAKGLISALQQNKNIQPAIDRGQTGLDTVLGNACEESAGNNILSTVEIIGQTEVMPQVLELAAGSSGLTEQNMAQDAKGLINTSQQNIQPSIDRGQTGLDTVLGNACEESAGNNVLVGTSNGVIDSKNSVININTEKAKRVLQEVADTGQKLMNNSEKLSVSEKLEVSGNQDGQKVSSLNTGLYVVEDKISGFQPRFIGVNSQKGQLAAEKTTVNVISSYQQGQTSTEASADSGKEQFNSFSKEFVLKDLVTNASSDSKDSVSSDLSSNSGINSDKFSQMLAANNGQMPVLEQMLPTVSIPKATGSLLGDSIHKGIREQIQETIGSSLNQGDKQVTIHLNPPELGKVSIKFQEQNGQITGLLEVDKPQTRYEIEHSLPEIIRNLTNSGVQIKRVEVVLTEQSGQQLSREQTMSSGQEGHLGWGQQSSNNTHTQENYPNWMGAYDWSGNDEQYYEFDPSRIQVTENSLNMLV
jgi:flagellar hook-length control protein FliK